MTAYDEAVLAWAQALRAGSTTPWSEFWPTAPATSGGGPLPGAAQLELTRLLATRWSGPGFEQVADRVLHRERPGRGLARNLPLTHPEAPAGPGAPPVDPAELPVDELIRLGVGVLADLAVAAPRPPRPRRVPWQRHRRPEPDPVVPPSGVEDLLTRAWSARVRRGAGWRWGRYVAWCAGRDLLPRDPGPGTLAPESVDLLRRTNRVLRLRVLEEDAEVVRETVVRLLGPGEARPLPVAARHQAWARSQAGSLAADGYPVEGDVSRPLDLRPLRRRDVLDHLVDVVVRSVEETREEQA